MAVFAPLPQQYFDNNGDPLSGGTIETYEAGTTTPKITYTSEDESTPNANPVVLDASGRADIWLESGSYRLVIRDDMGALIVELDDITGAAANVFGNAVVDVSTNLNVTSVYRNSVLRVDTSPITLTLLPASTAGEGFLFSVKNVSGGDITIDPDAAELIDGLSTLVLQDGQSALIVCDGSAWVSLFIAPDIVDEDNTFTGDNEFQGNDTFSGDVTFIGAVSFADDGELTISSGSITPTGVYHRVDTEADAATDDLDTITAGTSGQRLILRAEDDTRHVVIKHNTGNIVTSDEKDITLNTDKKNVSLIYDSDLSLWVVSSQPAAIDPFSEQLLHIQDQKAGGVDGGAFTSGAWQTRDLNTVLTNEITGASLSSNRFTLPAGEYFIEARAPAHGVGYHKAKLRNITDNSDALIGSTKRSRPASESGSTVTNDSQTSGRITIAGAKDFEIQHQCSDSYTEGFGRGNDFGVVEVYTDVKIWRLGD